MCHLEHLICVHRSRCNNSETVVCRGNASVLDFPPQKMVNEGAFAWETYVLHQQAKACRFCFTISEPEE